MKMGLWSFVMKNVLTERLMAKISTKNPAMITQHEHLQMKDIENKVRIKTKLNFAPQNKFNHTFQEN